MRSILFLFLINASLSSAQGVGKVWLETGVKGEITKKLDWGVELTNRFGTYGLETFFPQATLRYKAFKFMRLSVDYRAIFNKDEYTNYLFSNRINGNVDLKQKVNRFTFSGRVRYQYSFNSLRNNMYYDAEFDQAIRLKPGISYDIKDNPISLSTSAEFFYNPQFMEGGQQFTKLRAWAGLDYALEFGEKENKQSFDIGFGYIFDLQLNVSAPRTSHILNISIAYNIDN
jgi:hypothetical protein